jgi:hypothetical protein
MRTPAAVAAALACAALAGFAVLASTARADVFLLRNGDRVTGHPYLRGTKFVRVDTGYGKLRIPLASIERIIGDDGQEEVLNPDASAAGSPLPAAGGGPGPSLSLEIEGNVFWYAWPRKDDQDPNTTLELAISLDDDVVAVYTDPITNPSNIGGAVVNSFSFRADETQSEGQEGVVTHDADVTPGRIALALDLPPSAAGERLLKLTYRCSPRHGDSVQDAAGGAAIVRLESRRSTTIRVAQDAGAMSYTGFLGRFGRKMKNVGSFRVDLSLGDPGP